MKHTLLPLLQVDTLENKLSHPIVISHSGSEVYPYSLGKLYPYGQEFKSWSCRFGNGLI